jgi:hypothetical protein
MIREALRHLRWTRAVKATVRFLLLIGGLTAFGVSFVLQMRAELPSAWTAMGLELVCLAALFYDPENPPDMKRVPPDDMEPPHNRRSEDA